jgi:hypothetical protein
VIDDLCSCKWRLCSGPFVDEHLDGSARVIERADDPAIVEVPCVQLQVGMMLCTLRRKSCRASENKRPASGSPWSTLDVSENT